VAITRPRRVPATLPVALISVAVLLAACGGTPSSSAATASPAPTVASPGPSSPAGSSQPASPVPSTGPAATPSPPASGEPLATASPSPSPGSADACSGTAENRDFYAALAASVTWDVYCPVLPSGWYVESGSYRLSNGGQLSITYRGPGGAHIVIQEGNYCAGASDCVPTGTDAGGARFGDRDARLLDLGGGTGVVLVVPAGADAGWQATGSGIDGPALAAYTAAFARVEH
jgi:hypothetical protein